MLKKEVTTKGAGHGIGLYNVSEVLNDNAKYFKYDWTENNSTGKRTGVCVVLHIR